MRFGEKVVRYRFVILIVAVLLLIPSVVGYLMTGINYDMLTYLPDDMETMQGQKLLQKDFHKGGFTIVVTENLSKSEVSKLAKDYEKIEHVDTVLNLEEVLDPAVPRSMYPKIIRDDFENEDASMIVVFFDTSTSDAGSLEALSEIRAVSSKNCFASGMTALVVDLKNLCEQEEAKYVLIAVLLSLVVMMLLLDSYIAPFLFLISIGMAILYNLGSNIVFGEISYITKAIAAVLQLGVTLDYSIFLWHSFMEKLDKGMEEKEAMGQAINATLVSVTGSSVTTIAGFLALCFMTYTMGMDLGLVMAKGVVFGVICSVTVLPALLLQFTGLLRKTRHRTLIPDASKLSHRLTSRYGVFIVVFAILLLPAVYGYSQMNTVYDFAKILNGSQGLSDEQAPVMKANDKLREDFGIASTHMIIADGDLDPEKGYRMEQKIQEMDGVQSVLGMDTFIGPDIPREMLPDSLSEALISNGHQLILVNSAYTVSTPECNHQIDMIKNVVNEYDETAKVIGEGPATQDLITLTDKDFRVVNIISIIAVFLIILFVLRSLTLPFILVAAIEFAIYLNLGICGYTGLDMPFIVPVCISTIQLGSTVDYAILTSTRYKTERMEGRNRREAVETASRTSIPSILVSAIGFFTATFGVAVYSNLGVISTMCGLMARGAIISMLTVIIILPSLLMAFDKIICRTTAGLRTIDRKETEGKAAA